MSSYLTEFHIKTGDLAPRFESQCVDGEGNPVDLTGVTTVRFHMNETDTDGAATSVNVIDAPAIVDDAAAGLVAYEWAEGDTDNAGRFAVEIEVVSGGKATTFPNDSNDYVNITPALL